MTDVRYKSRIKIKLIDEHLRGIGLVAVSWATLEEAVGRIVWRLSEISDDRFGMSITTHTNIQGRLDAALTLMNLRYPDTGPEKRLKKLNSYIRKHLMPARNEIIHSRVIGDLFSDPQVAARLTTRARGKLKHGYVDVIPSDYDETALAILGAATETRDILNVIIDLVRAEKDQPPPLHDTPD